jgi:hypothetical protein
VIFFSIPRLNAVVKMSDVQPHQLGIESLLLLEGRFLFHNKQSTSQSLAALLQVIGVD